MCEYIVIRPGSLTFASETVQKIAISHRFSTSLVSISCFFVSKIIQLISLNWFSGAELNYDCSIMREGTISAYNFCNLLLTWRREKRLGVSTSARRMRRRPIICRGGKNPIRISGSGPPRSGCHQPKMSLPTNRECLLYCISRAQWYFF